MHYKERRKKDDGPIIERQITQLRRASNSRGYCPNARASNSPNARKDCYLSILSKNIQDISKMKIIAKK